ELAKEETRRLAVELGLHVAGKPESQDICFVPTRDYRDYLREHAPGSLQPGPIRDGTGRVIGTHQGVAQYTIGQRRGLGVASSKPLFVAEIWPEENTLIVEEEASLYREEAQVSGVNWVAIDRPSGPVRVMAKARYKAEEVSATIEALPGGGAR